MTPRRWLCRALIVSVLAQALLGAGYTAGSIGIAGAAAQEATPEASPVATPSPGEPGSVFVSAEWRFALVAADRSPGINALSLERGAGRTWVVVVADVTNWSPNPSSLDLRQLRIAFNEDEEPGGFAPGSTFDVARILQTEPEQMDEPIEFAAEESKRIVVAYQVAEELTGPVIRYGDQGLPLDDLIAQEDISVDTLPPFIPAPPLERVLIDDIISGNELELYLPEEGESQRFQLIGVNAPTDGECFAPEAQDALAGRTEAAVLIESDPTVDEAADPPLRYAWIQNDEGHRTLLNRVLILQGFAAWSGEPEQARFAAWLHQAEDAAREGDTGLWEECGGPDVSPTPLPASPTAVPIAEPEEPVAPTATPALEPPTPPTEASEPTATPAPEPQPTATPEEGEESAASGDLPPAVAELVAEDDPDQCDRIGWGTPTDSVPEGQTEFYAACHDAGGIYVARCVGSTEGTGAVQPEDGRLWVVCVIVVVNGADEALFVSPVDFVLVDGDDQRYELDPAAMRALPDDQILASGEIAPEDQINGAIAFDAPQDATRPFRLQIVPLVEANAGTSRPAVIILEEGAAPESARRTA